MDGQRASLSFSFFTIFMVFVRLRAKAGEEPTGWSRGLCMLSARWMHTYTYVYMRQRQRDLALLLLPFSRLSSLDAQQQHTHPRLPPTLILLARRRRRPNLDTHTSAHAYVQSSRSSSRSLLPPSSGRGQYPLNGHRERGSR